ncbi:MAG TPA: right-handed parallel beta-helix repeat-containing protein [Longimicrobium sp.]|jgi:hypothetical protein
MTFVIREAGGVRFSEDLVLGSGLALGTSALGVPELLGGGEAVLVPSGGDDTAALQAALNASTRVRLAPGTFRIGATVTVPPGRALVGTGGQATEVVASHSGDAFALAVGPEILLGTQITAIEDLVITGPGYSVGTGVGISATQPGAGGSIDTRIRLRSLFISGFGGGGVLVQEANKVELYDVAARHIGGTGISLDGSGHSTNRLLCAGLVSAQSGSGIAISNFLSVQVANAQAIGLGGTGILVTGCAGLQLSGLQCIYTGGRGLHVQQCSGVAIDGASVLGCVGSLWVEACTGVSVGGLRSSNSSGHGVRISGGASVAMHGLVTDQSGLTGPVPAPHLLVDGGATEVLVTSLRKTNSAGGPPTFEADVAGAGGRVVFIQNNLDPARINSGGRFVQL